MKGLSVLLFLTSPLLLLAQIGFDNFATVPCFSGEGSVVLPEGWLAYQTVDDVWNGELEPEACMSINEGGSVYSAMLDLSEALEGKPVFLRRTLQLDLAPNTIWSVYLNWWWNSGSYAMLQTDCADSSDCSALLFRIQVPNHPDSTQVLADDIRVFPFKESQEIAYGDIQGVGGCLPTQYFEEQILLEVIYVLYPNWEIVGNDLEIPALEFNYTPWFELVNDANFYDTFYHSYNAELNTHNYNVFWGHRLVAYNPDQGYPSADNSSFIDIEPGDGLGSSMQQNIVVTLGELGTWDQIVVAFQPHSFFRGALVEGSDSLRHNLELVFANAELCGGLIVEYPVEPGNGLVFHESSVEFGLGNCFIIKEDAYLKVGEDGALNYGLDGKGMLALHPGSRVELEPGSYLQFGNTLVLEDKSGEDVPTYCDVFLHPGSTLSFAPSAKVKNFSPDERLKVRVHLMGGRVEFNALSAHERSHFEFIEFEEAHIAGIQVLGNPTSGPIRFRFDAPTDGQSRISVVDQLGNLLFTDYVSHMEGVNELLLPRLNTTGVVYLRVEHDGSSKVARVLIQP